ncbi:hypothetical protein BDK51DRAFT_47415, partial [Blyttiomyces helicus]
MGGIPDPIKNTYVAWAQPAFDTSRCLPLIESTTTFLPFYNVTHYGLISLPAFRAHYERKNTSFELSDGPTDIDLILWVLAYMGDQRNPVPLPNSVLSSALVKPLLKNLHFAAMSDQDRALYDANVRATKDEAARLEAAQTAGEARGIEIGVEMGKELGVKQSVINMKKEG